MTGNTRPEASTLFGRQDLLDSVARLTRLKRLGGVSLESLEARTCKTHLAPHSSQEMNLDAARLSYMTYTYLQAVLELESAGCCVEASTQHWFCLHLRSGQVWGPPLFLPHLSLPGPIFL
jgi:hypothetical protein